MVKVHAEVNCETGDDETTDDESRAVNKATSTDRVAENHAGGAVKWANERLEELVGFGRFQYFQIWVFLALVSLVGAMNMFHIIFLVTKNKHRCALPKELEMTLGQNYNFSSLLHVTGECTVAHLTDPLCNVTDPSQLQHCFNITNQITCEDADGFIHDTTSSDSFWSLSSEHDWVCDRAEYGSNVLVAQSVGIIISTMIFMQLSDKWGRSPVFHITNIIYIVMRIIALFITDKYIAFLVVIAMGSTFSPLGVRIGYTIVAESCNEVGRLWLYVSGWVAWVVGVAMLSLIAWLSEEWFVYGLVVPLCNLVFIPFIWLTPESPRLLLTQKKVDRAEKIVRKIREINQVESNKNLHQELTVIANKIGQEKVYGIITLFKSKRLALFTFLMSITWVVNDFFYIGGQLNVENLAGNQFVNFALVGLTELPSVFIGEFFISRLGRRWSHVGCMLITATLYTIIVIVLSVDPSLGSVVTGLAITAKTASNVGWFIMWVQCVELFPTCIRVTGSNLAALVANITCSCAPYVILLGDTDLKSMYGIFVMLGIIGAIATSFLPETFKQPFPECLEDVEEREHYPYFSWKVWTEEDKKHKTDV